MHSMRKAKSTHKSMGTVRGSQAGLESGIAEVRRGDMKGIETHDKTQRPKPQHHGSIAMK